MKNLKYNQTQKIENVIMFNLFQNNSSFFTLGKYKKNKHTLQQNGFG